MPDCREKPFLAFFLRVQTKWKIKNIVDNSTRHIASKFSYFFGSLDLLHCYFKDFQQICILKHMVDSTIFLRVHFLLYSKMELACIPYIDSATTNSSCDRMKFSCIMEALKIAKIEIQILVECCLMLKLLISSQCISYIEHVPVRNKYFTKE